jgi:hypothetical protein
MNKQLNPEKFNDFLSGNNRRTHQTNRPIQSIMIDHLEEIKRYAEESLGLGAKNYKEELRLTFRFNDLTPTAQEKLAMLLKKDSSLGTVYTTPLNLIKDRLNIANPVIASNYGDKFIYGSFNRWREQRLSRIVYYLGRNYRGDDEQLRTLAYLLNQ